MSKSVHKIEVQAKDQTAGAFASIGARAKAAGASIRSAMGGALAAAGAFMGIRAVSSTIAEMGKLSDQAMKAGMSVHDLTSTATAFQVAGLDIGVEQLTKAMQFLNKNTGKSGMGAFYDTVAEIAKIEDPAKRGAEMVKNFGRSGMELAPLINSGEDAVRKFRELQELMPGLSDGAANMGDAVADSQLMLGQGVKTLWQEVIGKILSMWGEDFPGGVRAGALNALNWIETFVHKAYAVLAWLGGKIGAIAGFISNALDGEWSTAVEVFKDQWEQVGEDFDKRWDTANEKREEFKAKLSQKNVDDLANPFGNKGGSGATSPAASAKEAATAIRNALITGGTNEAMKLAMLGPTTKEDKKVDLLEKIAQNTEKTADNTEESGVELTPLEG